MAEMVTVSVFVAFIAGIASFLSPCVLPLVPGFIAYLSGTSGKKHGSRFEYFMNSLFYVLGFSVVFALLGVLLRTVLLQVSGQVIQWLSRIGGIIIIFFALILLGLIRIPWFERGHTFFRSKRFSATYVTSFLFGAAFAVGWTPCVGALLGSVLALAVTQPGQSVVLLLAYSLGMGVPFLIVGLFTAEAVKWIKKSEQVFKWFNIIVGVLLILLGVLVFTQKLGTITILGASILGVPVCLM